MESAQLEMRAKADKGHGIHDFGEWQARVAVIVEPGRSPRIVGDRLIIGDTYDIGLLTGECAGECRLGRRRAIDAGAGISEHESDYERGHRKARDYGMGARKFHRCASRRIGGGN